MSDKWFDKFVPPDGPEDAKILVVGEAPGETEHDEGKPFVGESGAILIDCFNRHGIQRKDIRLANLFPYRPKGNDFKLAIGSTELDASIKELYTYILDKRPNVIAALGNWPLYYLTGYKGIKKWRGSILSFIGDKNVKVIPTIHPAAIFRDNTMYPVFDMDIRRIVNDSTFPEKKLPYRKFIINPTGIELEEWTQTLCRSPILAVDIETVKNSDKILCVGFAPSANLAVCLEAESFSNKEAIQRILASDADKIFQFGTFDTIQLANLNGYQINPGRFGSANHRPYYWDTLVAQHTFAPELPRSLEYLTSIYTREPYYKTVGRGTIPDDEKGWSVSVERQGLYEYNCRDCCCTFEIFEAQSQQMEAAPSNFRAVFDFQMQMLAVSNHISTSGMLVDERQRQIIEDIHIDKWNRKQSVLDQLCGCETNVRSPKLKDILDKLGLPPRFKDKRRTTDEDAIVSLITFSKDKIESLKTADGKLRWEINLAVCKLILEIRGIRVVLSNYIRKIQKNKRPRASEDGRIRSTFKAPGTETGRWSSSKFVDGRGFNAQTLPRDPLEVEDELWERRLVNYANTMSLKGVESQSVLMKELDDDEVDDDNNEEEAA